MKMFSEDSLQVTLFGSSVDELRAKCMVKPREPFEGEIRNDEMYHNGKWCRIVRHIANIYVLDEKNS